MAGTSSRPRRGCVRPTIWGRCGETIRSLVSSSARRRQALPAAGPVVTIEALSEEQQLELARAARGEEGVELVDRAWRTPGVRELVGIPLYLKALLALPAGAPFPETKEAVLGMFVQENERAPARVERLERDTLRKHRKLLVGLAEEANRAGRRRCWRRRPIGSFHRIMRQLAEDGQIGAPPHPQVVIAGLVGAHLLVRGVGAEGTITFQHQLFQEWYARAEVEALMRQAARGDAGPRRRLREDILNWPSWEESVLFACERLSRQNGAGAAAVAGAIEETLGIDPILAAEMIYRSAEATWLQRPRPCPALCGPLAQSGGSGPGGEVHDHEREAGVC